MINFNNEVKMTTINEKINVIVSYDNDTQETFDMNVNVRPKSFNASINSLRMYYFGQIIDAIKGDKSQIVKISTRFYNEEEVFFSSDEYAYLMHNWIKVWFQEDQRDDLENALVKKYNLASNTRKYSEKWTEDIDMAFPINNIANSVLKVTVGLQQSEKKMTFDDVLKQGQFGGMVKLAQDESDLRGLRYSN